MYEKLEEHHIVHTGEKTLLGNQFISKQQYQYFAFSSGNCIWPMEEKLEEHQIVHTGEKPLLGNLCDKIFF